MIYPDTRRSGASIESFGHTIADPYRWLEADSRRDPEVAGWIEAQNAVSEAYLAGLEGRDRFRARLTALFDYERLTVPTRRADRYFFTRNTGLESQSTLVVRDGIDGTDRIVIDPGTWSTDGTTALAEWAASDDGTLVAYAVQQDGSDWRTVRVLDVDTGTVLDDQVAWARFTNLAWAPDGSGFFYSRNPEPSADATFESQILGHSVCFHRLGTPQSQDRVVHAPKVDYPMIHTVDVTADGRYAVIYSTAMTGGNALSMVDLADPDWPLVPVIDSFDQAWTLAGNRGSRLFLLTQDGAERGRIVMRDLKDPQAVISEVVPERPDAVLRLASLIGERLIVSWMVDAQTEVERFTLDGSPDRTVDLPGIGSAGSFEGRPGEDEAFFVFTAHDVPLGIYRYHAGSNTTTPWATPRVAVDLDRIVVEQRFCTSRDGTKVPVFIVRRDDVQGQAPAMLHAYGGFGIPMLPFYNPAAMAWVDQGGVWVTAAVRGGGEYGRAWHDAGKGALKQNVFDDVIAAAEYLKAEGIVSADGLAIQGESNGGLLVGAVVNQRPDLFAAALPGVGVLDMLRFDQFTGGLLWAAEFGSPSVEADFRNLLAYSPLHNIASGTDYPAILVTTADTDDRVVPGHSFKYTAALQAADLGHRPRILRVETQAGHGAGKPTEKVIEELADMWAFAAHWTGLSGSAA